MSAELGAFILLMALGQFSPGPDMILLTRTALAEGLRSGLFTVLGIVSGLSFHATIALAGMAAILTQGGWVETSVKILAASYLLWLSYGLLRSDGRLNSVNLSNRSPYFRGLFCNLFNPKVAVFFAGAVTPFLNHLSPVVIWVIIVGEGLLLWSLWVILLQRNSIRAFYEKAGRWIDRIFACALLVLAVTTLLSLR